MVKCGLWFKTYNLAILNITHRGTTHRETRPACSPLECWDKPKESHNHSSCLIPKSLSFFVIIMIRPAKTLGNICISVHFTVQALYPLHTVQFALLSE